jgi:hypothetical protein
MNQESARKHLEEIAKHTDAMLYEDKIPLDVLDALICEIFKLALLLKEDETIQ